MVPTPAQENMVLAKMELFNVVLHEEPGTISDFSNMEPVTGFMSYIVIFDSRAEACSLTVL